MHQRHVATSNTEAPTDSRIANGNTSIPHGSSSTSSSSDVPEAEVGRKAPRRRKGASKYAAFTSKHSGKKRLRKFRGIAHQLDQLFDLDIFSSLLQFVSILIMLGCAIALLTHWLHASPLPNRGPPQDQLVGAPPVDPHLSSNGKSWWHALDIFGLFSQSWRFRDPPHRGAGLNAKYPRIPLTPSSIYTIPGSMSHIGDKSDSYAALRKEFDAIQDQLPDVPQKMHFTPITDDVPYDIYNCPDEPPEGYPYAWLLLDVLKAWPADDPTPRPNVYQGLCVFDYRTDLEKAYNYRSAEVPFIVQHDPAVTAAVKRWNAPTYMERMLGHQRHRAEYSENNHFMYWNMPSSRTKQQRRQQQLDRGEQDRKNRNLRNPPDLKDWKKPTEMLRMTYRDWLDHANVTASTPEEQAALLGPDKPHWYFRLIGCGETGPQGQCDNGSSEYLFDELTFFQPKEGLYLVDPDEQKGIHCRFGMRGVIAENHFDGSRNAIAVLGGERRYLLSHPNQCDFLALLPKGHPSARHSAVDWSNPDLDSYPEFAAARGNEVVLQAGDVLYLPTNWFHYIISLSLNFQCNTRSGVSQDYMKPIHQCGF